MNLHRPRPVPALRAVLPAASRVCPFCGFNQFAECAHCHRPTYVHGRFCTACGQVR